jgi:hypothetical protein
MGGEVESLPSQFITVLYTPHQLVHSIDKLELELEIRNQLINFDLKLEIKYKLAFLSGWFLKILLKLKFGLIVV